VGQHLGDQQPVVLDAEPAGQVAEMMADRFGRKPVYITGMLGTAVMIWPSYGRSANAISGWFSCSAF
jgi:hypothetical protein